MLLTLKRQCVTLFLQLPQSDPPFKLCLCIYQRTGRKHSRFELLSFLNSAPAFVCVCRNNGSLLLITYFKQV